MRIMITGGAGFQGSHIAESLLEEGHQITILNTYSQDSVKNISQIDNRISVVWGSITDEEIVRKTTREHDAIIHLAALIHVDQSVQSPGSFIDVNIKGTYNILEAVREYGNRLIFSSSCEVYGATKSGLTYESAELNPHSPYAASKAGADRMCFAYWKTYGLDVTIVRPCNIYGPRQKSGKGGAVIPIFVDLALSGKPLTVFGSGEQTREYMHVNDLNQAYKLVLANSNLQGEVLNFGTSETPSIKDIANFIAAKIGTNVVYGNARPGEVSGFKLSSEKAIALGFKPDIPFWKGLDEYIKYRQSA